MTWRVLRFKAVALLGRHFDADFATVFTRDRKVATFVENPWTGGDQRGVLRGEASRRCLYC
jgi:hypothetical protein